VWGGGGLVKATTTTTTCCFSSGRRRSFSFSSSAWRDEDVTPWTPVSVPLQRCFIPLTLGRRHVTKSTEEVALAPPPPSLDVKVTACVSVRRGEGVCLFSVTETPPLPPSFPCLLCNLVTRCPPPHGAVCSLCQVMIHSAKSLPSPSSSSTSLLTEETNKPKLSLVLPLGLGGGGVHLYGFLL